MGRNETYGGWSSLEEKGRLGEPFLGGGEVWHCVWVNESEAWVLFLYIENSSIAWARDERLCGGREIVGVARWMWLKLDPTIVTSSRCVSWAAEWGGCGKW